MLLGLLLLLSASSARAEWVVGTFAGTGTRGLKNGPALSALFDTPSDLVVHPVTGVTYVSDTENNCIRSIDLEGMVTTLVEGGNVFAAPSGLALDPQLNTLFFTDTKLHAVYSLWLDQRPGPPTPKLVLRNTVQQPHRLAVHSAGHLAITALSSHAVYLLLLGCRTAGEPCTCSYGSNPNSMFFSLRTGPCVVPIGSGSDCGHVDGTLSFARFCNPSGLAFSPDGDLFIADTRNDAVRVIVLSSTKYSREGGASTSITNVLDSLSSARVATLSGGARNAAGEHGAGQGDGARPVNVNPDADDGNERDEDDPDEEDDDDDRDQDRNHSPVKHPGRRWAPDARATSDMPWWQHALVNVNISTRARRQSVPSTTSTSTSKSNTGLLLRQPVDLALSPDGARLFVADTKNSRIVMLGKIPAVIAGSEAPGYEDGRALHAKFGLPSGIAVVSASVVLVADSQGNVIRSLVQTRLADTATAASAAANKAQARSFLPTLLLAVCIGTLVLFIAVRAARRHKLTLSGATSAVLQTAQSTARRLAQILATSLQRFRSRYRDAYAMAPPYQRVPRAYLETTF